MDVITAARNLGHSLQSDGRYAAVVTAQQAVDNNKVLQEKITALNNLRFSLNTEIMRKDKDETKVAQLNTQLQTLYKEIMTAPEMLSYNKAKTRMDTLLAFLSQILSGSANGLDPDTIEYEENCSGSCSSCSGCS